MNSTFTCPHCGLVSDIDPAHIGKSGPCRGCGKEVTVPVPKEANLPPTATSRGSATPWIIGCAVIAVVGFVLLGLLACGGAFLFSFRTQQVEMQQQMYRAEEAERAAMEADANLQKLSDEVEKSGDAMEKAASELEKKAEELAQPPSEPAPTP